MMQPITHHDIPEVLKILDKKYTLTNRHLISANIQKRFTLCDDKLLKQIKMMEN